MHEIHLHRQIHTDESTIGYMDVFGEGVWTLEDPRRQHKVFGETRIPAGHYRLELRTEGGMSTRYAARFPNMHRGMIWLRSVPMFEWVYIHIGNTAKDTEGCILVGLAKDNDLIVSSVAAYERIYPRIVDAIENGGCTLTVHDEDED